MDEGEHITPTKPNTTAELRRKWMSGRREKQKERNWPETEVQKWRERKSERKEGGKWGFGRWGLRVEGEKTHLGKHQWNHNLLHQKHPCMCVIWQQRKAYPHGRPRYTPTHNKVQQTHSTSLKLMLTFTNTQTPTACISSHNNTLIHPPAWKCKIIGPTIWTFQCLIHTPSSQHEA